MNAERLLALYEKVAEAPDAVPRLRRFVLDLAVRGKLVPQEAGEPVAERYLKLTAPAGLPANWRALNFGRFCNIEGGNQPPKSQFSPEPKEGYVRLFQIRDLGDNPVPVYIPEKSTKRFCRDGEILIGRYGASVGKVFWAQNGAYNVALTKFTWPEDALAADFAFLLLKSDLFQDHLAGASRSAQAGFNKKDLASLDFPLPPLAEQRRIVAKVEELIALLDRLEAARTAREATRDRLTAASLARLTASDTGPDAEAPEAEPGKVGTGLPSGSATTKDSFPANARFALATLPALTTRPDQIKPLRQTILNLAVRGKLVDQDPTDEPVSLPQSGEVECPEPLPKGWSYARLADLLAENTRNGFSRRPDDAEDGVPILRISAGTVRQDGVVAEEEHKLISGIDAATRLQYGLRRGDLLACRFNGNKAFVGRLTLFYDYLGLDPIYPDKLIRVRLERRLAVPEFVRMAGESDLVRGNIEEFCATTVGNWGISASNLKQVPVPLPPLAEQHRIVAQVDALMALCDRLEAALTSRDNTRARLLEALLHEALDPAAAAATEAAE